VVNLLKEMSATLQKEMEEDEDLFNKLGCWCNTNEYEKGNSISEAEAKIAELEALIESLTAKVAELKAKIKEVEEEVAANKKALAEATALREKQIQEFHGGELDNIQAIENLKAAIVVLGKHHGGNLRDAFPQLSLSFLSLGGKDSPWSPDHETDKTHSFDQFMRHSGFDEATAVSPTQKFLQQESQPLQPAGWSGDDAAIVQRALKSASAFVQSRHGDQYYPSYSARSGEIMGVLKQLKEEMEGDLGEAQKEEKERAVAFAELRAAKTKEIEEGEQMAERKEDELAQAMNDLAEAKEDLGQVQAALSEEQKFMMNLKKTCAEADKNFELRKNARLSEIKAVSETIEILMKDEARDAMTGTYNFLQISKLQENRKKAARLLRSMATKTGNPELVALATAVELDAFTKVKKAIDDMIAMLKQQTEDEVKKHDWCNVELQETEMTTMKTEDLRADLLAKTESLAATITRLTDEIAAAKSQINELQVNLQRASEDRKRSNRDFQKTLSDQMATQAVLAKALDRLATYYDKVALVQRTGHGHAKQTPPVPQMEYKPSSGASGVMQMIEKLIYEAKDLIAKSKQGEGEEQSAYESLVADTNDSVATLQEEVVTKTKNKSEAETEKIQTEGDLNDAVDELERLSKYTADMHAECDYLLKNFDIRQAGRGQEIEALQQAKQILSGADFN